MANAAPKVRGFALHYDEEFIKAAEAALRGVLERGWTSEGVEVRRFEEAFGALCPAKHRIATPSCTLALEIAFRALNVKDRRVLVPTNTFYATALAAVNAGARVELVDVDADTFALCPTALRAALEASPEDLPAVVVLVHVGGTIPGNVREIQSLCAGLKVPLVEDAAQAHGAVTADGLHAGCIGVVACFSFFSTKVMTTGEGGMIVTNDADLASKIQNLKNFGRVAGGSAADLKCEIANGVNGRVPEVVGLLGALECGRAPARIARRQHLLGIYAEGLKDEPFYQVLRPPDGQSSCYKVIVRLLGGLSRNLVREGCKQRGVELSGEVWATPVHRQPAFQAAAAGRAYPVADALADSHICPPLYPELTEEDVQIVVDALLEIARAHRASSKANGFSPPLRIGVCRYAVLSHAGQLEVKEMPIRPPGPGEVLVRVRASGICGSDLHYFRHGGLGSFAAKLPMRLGHEVAGVVEALGEGVDSEHYIGEHVALEPAGPCRICDICNRGRKNLCGKATFFGAEGSDTGGMADTMVVPARQLVSLPKGISLRVGAMLEPLAVALYACRVVSLASGETFGVIGCGGIGLCTLFCALKEGGVNVWCTDPVSERRTMATKYGASAVLPASELKGKQKPEVVFDVAGTDPSFTAALDTVAPGGRVALVGIPEQDHLLLNPHRARTKGITIFNIRRSNVSMEECIPLVSEPSDAKLVEDMVTHSFDFDNIQQHFEIASKYTDGVIRCVLEPGGSQS